MILSLRDLQYNYLKSLYSKSIEIISNQDGFYKTFSETKYNKDGTPKLKQGIPQVRTFHVPNKDLSKIQKIILRQILEKIELPTYVLGGLKKRSSVLNAALHKGNKFKFQTDLSNFFPSVSSAMVCQMLERYGFSSGVANILTKLTTVKSPEALRGDCLPQGASTSPYLANLVFNQVDEKLMAIIKINNLTYTRYFDDLTFSSNTCFQEIIPEIIRIINSNGYQISRKKTTYKCGRAVITGVDVGNNTIKASQEFYDKESTAITENQKRGRSQYIKTIKGINQTKTKKLTRRISNE